MQIPHSRFRWMLGRMARAGQLLINNPRFFLTKARRKLPLALPVPHGPIIKPIEGVNFEFDFDLLPSMRLMYRGAFEPETMVAMKRMLAPGGTFVDGGASVGYLSAVAMGIVGPKGTVHSFEPAPKYFERLERLGKMNPTYKLLPHRLALGDESGWVELHLADGSKASGGRNTLLKGLTDRDHFPTSVKVRSIRLDEYLLERREEAVSLIKIDVEGYELAVLRGLAKYLEGHRPPIICEIFPASYPLFGGHIADTWKHMATFGYEARDLVDPCRRLSPRDLDPSIATNVLFVVDNTTS